MKVLVAEDNAENRQLLEDILKGRGYVPLFARDGYEAMASALGEKPDLIILDINMPGIDGFEVCARLKNNPDTNTIPILMLTALADIEYRVKGLGLGADDYITKPYSPRELVARIDTRLRIKSDADSLRATQERIIKTFEQFVPATVVDKLLQQPDQVKLGGQLQEITILFADLGGFSTVSEQAEPEILLSALNKYLGLLIQHIQAEEGTIDKFFGDGIMALYNTPLQQEDHVLRAIKSALSIRDALADFHQTMQPLFRLPVNFGIHTGEALVGNVGTDQLMDYTAIGDAVNLASRLQNMSQNGQILISEYTYERVKDVIDADCLGLHTARGRESQVVVYDVKGTK